MELLDLKYYQEFIHFFRSVNYPSCFLVDIANLGLKSSDLSDGLLILGLLQFCWVAFILSIALLRSLIMEPWDLLELNFTRVDHFLFFLFLFLFLFDQVLCENVSFNVGWLLLGPTVVLKGVIGRRQHFDGLRRPVLATCFWNFHRQGGRSQGISRDIVAIVQARCFLVF